MIWYKRAWKWLKKHWKYVITFGIPVALSAIVSLIKSNQSLKNKTEFKANEQIINKQASELEAQILQGANKDFHDDTQDAFDDWTEDMEEIQDNKKATINSINSAEAATQAIKNKLGE